ncbi:dephospho-CoA kinase [Paenibacillus algicola]|uniref:Dephospho-CoA kinase n=1 Tax=Paenibacillus algicola TaxID=2565926 RepID=A0A4P8XP55_9BACL|nr:dephospho-CoA kinase [Paenibacillus algicola]QCT03550.1 dephospho-CoA kinase [Paenibacillus algicola]
MNIGLTGGIATGKSTVSSMFVRKGALLVDADAIAREVMLPGHPVLAEVAAHFGPDILGSDGQLNRERLGEIVFNQPQERQALNDITHPAIRREIRDRIQVYEQQHPDSLVIVDIPLLFESGLQAQYDQTLLVYVPAKLQLERLMQRNGLTREQAAARIQSQMDIEEKKSLADYVIDNSGTLDETLHQVEKLWNRIARL